MGEARGFDTSGKNGSRGHRIKELPVPNYRKYVFSRKEILQMLGEYLLLSSGFAYLFYRSVITAIILWVFFPLYYKKKSKKMAKKKQEQLGKEFKDSIQSVATSLAAGYSIENAFRKSYQEMKHQYGNHANMVLELQYINSSLSLNVPLEQLLNDFADRSGLEDVRSFCEVFTFAKRSGGDFIQIIHMTVTRIAEKNEIIEDIQTEITGKRVEQKVMNLMPAMILLYVDISFSGYLDVLYGNPVGIAVMSICLAVYLGAYFLSEKIMDITV